MTFRRRLRPLAALAVIASVGVGCGSSAPSDSATAGSTASATATRTAGSGKKKLTAREKAVKFAECIRAPGVSDFPDPDAKNDFEYGVSVGPAVWTKAVDACNALQPPGTLSPKRTPAQQKEGLSFAKCMRENGVKDFPDPVQGEPLINTYRIPSSNKPGGMTILNAAIQKCRKLGPKP